MKDLYISDAPIIGPVVLFAVVQRRDLREAKNGRKYLSVTLSDRTGSLEGVCWDGAEELMASAEPETVVKVQGLMGEFNGQPQITIQRMRAAGQGEYDIADFLPTSKHDRLQMLDRLFAYARSTRKPIDQILRRLIEAHDAALLDAPAAQKVHHAFVGGLLEHVLSMCGAAERLCDHYSRLDRDVLIAGCILHDFAKLRELSVGLSFGYTTEGQLVGHIGLGLLMLEDACAGLPVTPELKLRLAHMIASHHGRLEHGAMKIPATPEAIALHHIDALDAKLEQMWRLIDEADAEFTARDKYLETAVYCGGRAAAVAEEVPVSA